MGWESNDIFQVVIVKGNIGGVFIYNASDQLVDSMAFLANVDPDMHSNLPGTVTYSPGQSYVQLNQGAVAIGSLNNGSKVTAPADLKFNDALFNNIAPQLELDSPVTSAGGQSSLTLQGESVDGTQLAAIIAGGPVFEFGSTSFGRLVIVMPSGDTSGASDTAALNFALNLGSVQLCEGTYYLNGQVTISNGMLAGCGYATIIRNPTTGAGYAGPLLAAGAKSWITGLTVSNSGSDAITVAGGIAEWWLTDLNFASNTGYCINATITGPAHGRIRGIRGQGGGAANGGGIFLNGGSGGAITAEVNLYDIDIQNCQTASVLNCSAVTDIRCAGPLNGSIASGVAVPAIHVQGACQSINIGDVDVGGGAPGVLVVEGLGGNSPSEIQIGPGVVQNGGGAGVIVSDSSARIWFDRLMSKRNQGDGWLWGGTGAFNRMSGCGGNLNNQAAGVAYDVESTSSAHILNDGFSYVSGGVTAGRNLAAGNHYTEANPPSSITTVGAAPGGW